MADLKIRNLVKAFGKQKVLHGIDLDIRAGEFIVFVGPSGCGKSTLLRIIAGLEDITGGSIEIDGKLVNDLPPASRGIAMVFQSYALYPHMDVFANMSFGLRIAGIDREEIKTRVGDAAAMLQVDGLMERLPKQLSGGQRQRVAIGRAITRDPKVFLFDEPLSNLDAALRVATRIEIARLKESMPGTTMIYVTHDQVEAMTLANRIVVLNQGRIEQVGTPMELYHSPANRFVAGFIGSPAMNFLEVMVGSAGVNGTIASKGGDVFPVEYLPPDAYAGETVILGVRPEHLRPAPNGPALIRGRIDIVENLGEMLIVYVNVGEGESIRAKLPGGFEARRGDAISLGATSEHLHLFSREGKALSNRLQPTRENAQK